MAIAACMAGCAERAITDEIQAAITEDGAELPPDWRGRVIVDSEVPIETSAALDLTSVEGGQRYTLKVIGGGKLDVPGPTGFEMVLTADDLRSIARGMKVSVEEPHVGFAYASDSRQYVSRPVQHADLSMSEDGLLSIRLALGEAHIFSFGRTPVPEPALVSADIVGVLDVRCRKLVLDPEGVPQHETFTTIHDSRLGSAWCSQMIRDAGLWGYVHGVESGTTQGKVAP